MAGSKKRSNACAFCGHGAIVIRRRNLDFTQDTDRGTVFVNISVRVGQCDACGAIQIDDRTEALIAEAVEEGYRKLGPRC
jgi:hypothetical protein